MISQKHTQQWMKNQKWIKIKVESSKNLLTALTTVKTVYVVLIKKIDSIESS